MLKLSVLFQRHFAPTWLINKGSKTEARPCYKPVMCLAIINAGNLGTKDKKLSWLQAVLTSESRVMISVIKGG